MNPNRRDEIGKKYTAYNVYIISFKIQKFKEITARRNVLIFFTCFSKITHLGVAVRHNCPISILGLMMNGSKHYAFINHTTYREDFDCRAVQIAPLDG